MHMIGFDGLRAHRVGERCGVAKPQVSGFAECE